MAEAPSITSLFGDIVSPEAVRQQQEAQDMALGKYMAENVGSAGMLNLPSHARNVMRSIGGITGAETRSPAEIKAAENQKLFNDLMSRAAQKFPSSSPNSRSQQLNFVADELQKLGKTTEAMKARDAAQASQLQESKIYSEQALGFQREQAGVASKETAATTVAKRAGEVDKLAAQIAKEKAGTALTQEQLVTEILTRNPKLSKLEAETAANTALANQRNVETRLSQEEAPIKRNLIRAEISAKMAGVRLDEEKVKLVASQISTEEVKKRAEEQNISLMEAKEKLVDEELTRYIAMTPIEILKANTEIAKNKTQAELDKARLADVGMTEFTRNLAQLDATDEEKQKLLRKYAEAKASSGGVAGVRSKAIDAKVKLVTDALDIAEGAQTAMNNAQRMVEVIPDLTTGVAAEPRAALKRLINASGVFDGFEDDVVADQIFKVMRGGSVLEAAGNLKGALSDKDLKFLQETVANRELTKEVIAEAFSKLYYRRYADLKIAGEMEKLLNLDDVALRNTNITQLKSDFRVLYEAEAKGMLPMPVFD